MGPQDKKGPPHQHAHVPSFPTSVPSLLQRKDRATDCFTGLAEIPAIFEAYNEGDVAVDPKLTVLWIKQSGLGLPSADYYNDHETMTIYTEIIRATLASIYEGLGEDVETDAAALAADVVTLEKQLAKISLGV